MKWRYCSLSRNTRAQSRLYRLWIQEEKPKKKQALELEGDIGWGLSWGHVEEHGREGCIRKGKKEGQKIMFEG